MAEAILILALLFVAFVALGAYLSVKAVKAAKRGVDRTIDQARRTVEDTTLRARSYGQAGAPAELARLRLALRTSMRATQDALEAGVAEDASLKESLALFGRLSAHGKELDADLRRMERDPDRSRVAAHLDEVRRRTEQVTHAADSLRWAARDRAQRFADDELESLSAQIDMEAGALRHWAATDEPGSGTGATGSGAATGGSAAASAWPEAPTGRQSTSSEQVWPADEGAPAVGDSTGRPDGRDPAEGRSEEAGPQAITARDPRLQSFSWQKTARPETTN
ncbi:hypothetical protein [Streptomyces sp. NPDC046887]|uniref:hypothetical protein n=1 Tax=Streptomyces sp. NPDC046887 TaxID=3155472 RepID=UPI0033E80FB5